MQVNPFSSLTSALGTGSANAAKTTASSNAFSDVLAQAIGGAVETDLADKADTAAILSGEDIELHDSMLTATKAELSLNLAIQIRNKVVDAYNEIMRMQV